VVAFGEMGSKTASLLGVLLAVVATMNPGPEKNSPSPTSPRIEMRRAERPTGAVVPKRRDEGTRAK